MHQCTSQYVRVQITKCECRQLEAERAQMKTARGYSGLCMLIVPLITILLIVARLSTASYDVFIILIPFFIVVSAQEIVHKSLVAKQ
jgi:hypothetical protein